MSTLSIPPVVPSPREDAIQLYKAFKGFGCNTGAVVHILARRDATHRSHIRQEYRAMYSEDILERSSNELKGKLELLLAYVSTLHSEGMEVDKERAAYDAKVLHNGGGEKKLGTNEMTFIEIFSKRSRGQLVAIGTAYHDMYGSSLKKAVKSETSGFFELALLTIIRCAENPANYFAKVVHGAMDGLGTDDATLIRVVVTRTELDMRYIKAEYSKKYKNTLNDAVESETSGDYKSFLLHLLDPKCYN